MRILFPLLVAVMLAGCISSPPIQVEEASPWLVGEPLPAFELADQENQTWNGTSANGSGRWVAYFSASWCTHCKPTMDALDEAIAPEHLLVFNKEAREGYDNMTEWKADMEEEIGRNLSRPFIHAPTLSEAVNVTVIPHVLLIEDGTILAARIGLWNSTAEMSAWFDAAAPDSGMTQSM